MGRTLTHAHFICSWTLFIKDRPYRPYWDTVRSWASKLRFWSGSIRLVIPILHRVVQNQGKQVDCNTLNMVCHVHLHHIHIFCHWNLKKISNFDRLRNGTSRSWTVRGPLIERTFWINKSFKISLSICFCDNAQPNTWSRFPGPSARVPWSDCDCMWSVKPFLRIWRISLCTRRL